MITDYVNILLRNKGYIRMLQDLREQFKSACLTLFRLTGVQSTLYRQHLGLIIHTIIPCRATPFK